MTAAKETTLNQVGEMLGYVVENMATKDDIKDTATKDDIGALKTELKGDIVAMGHQISDVERDLRQIRRDLYELSERVENISGYRKEIDHALEHIAAIERHLGIRKAVA